MGPRMIIVTGSVIANAGQRDALLTECVTHSRRSRAERGCISHAVHIDAENPDRLVFLEEWQDMPALLTHFKVPASGAFVANLRAMAAAKPEMKIFEANAVSIGG
jgi:quinol monooxygenase YgiN